MHFSTLSCVCLKHEVFLPSTSIGHPRGCTIFTALEHLTLTNVSSYVFDPKNEDEIEAHSFPQNLRSLFFYSFRKVTSLPKGMQNLTSLQDLSLWRCDNLKTLPEWIGSLSSLKSLNIDNCPALKSLPEAMPQLTSLQSLIIWGCPELQERCKEPDREDRPKIQHIPCILLMKVLQQACKCSLSNLTVCSASTEGNIIEVAPTKWERIPVPLFTPPPGDNTVCWGRRDNGYCESVLYVEDDDARNCTPDECFTVVANSTGVFRRDRHFNAWLNLGEFCDEH
ncbi:putative disease resistance protein RGA4 [Bienertia sinuspersici]